MDEIEITYYTDPLCCWSWGMEPAIRRLRQELADEIKWTYCMGGLIPNWNRFTDPVNHVNRPIQMGPVWMHAAKVTGMDIDHNIWFRDPPSSSYPPCIAFKSVQLQSVDFALRYLELLRSACMNEGINISTSNELIRLAKVLDKEIPGFDIKQFIDDFRNGNGAAAFKKDLDEVRLKNITRFPTLLFRKKGCDTLIATGYRPYSALMEILDQLSPGLSEPEDNSLTTQNAPG